MGNIKINGVDCSNIFGELSADEFSDVMQALDKLAKYEKAEEQGRMITFPCAVGDTLYYIGYSGIEEFTVSGYRLDPDKGMYICTEPKDNCGCDFNVRCIGTRWFLTRKEAEEKMNGMLAARNK